jgi:hypothetical protein
LEKDLTRKHFEQLADWARASKLTVKQLDALMKILKQTNKLFDADKFWERARNG